VVLDVIPHLSIIAISKGDKISTRYVPDIVCFQSKNPTDLFSIG
jgi:hypothetical protein